MKLTFTSGSIDEAPKEYVRMMLTDEAKGTKRFIQEGETRSLVVGAGKPEEMNARKFIILCRTIVQAAKANKCRKIAIQFDRTPELFKNLQPLTPEHISQIAAENFEMANFEFNTFKTEPKEGWDFVEEIQLYGKSSTSIENAAQKGTAIGEAVNACRALANTPGGDMTPSILAKAAKDAVHGLPVTVEILDEKETARLGMNAVLGIAKGSNEKPTFTIMEYKGGTGKPIVLVGKGVTFDTGGLNLKPSNSIYEMHMDMSGAASVIYSVQLAARLGLKQHVVGLFPAVENMPGASAIHPGDIVKSLSGKTIEVTDTDAEGRVILADALTYAKRFDPSVVIDIATLTGAAHVALGDHASALLTRDDALAEKLSQYGEASGDYVWRLPLWDEYEEKVKGTFADVSNVQLGPASRVGGAIDGGMFLWQFAKELECPWAHIDMAPRMTAAPGDELAKGAAGAPVRLLLHFIEQWTA